MFQLHDSSSFLSRYRLYKNKIKLIVKTHDIAKAIPVFFILSI